MATRSYICLEQENGTYLGVYCHHDGFIEGGVGEILAIHYTDRSKVEKLISLGDLSRLGAQIEPNPNYPHSFDNPQQYVCVFYGRDRGEIDTEATEVELKEIDLPDSLISYCYVYTLKNRWKFFENNELEKYGLRDLLEYLDGMELLSDQEESEEV